MTEAQGNPSFGNPIPPLDTRQKMNVSCNWAIVPGSVNRTSIRLEAAFWAILDAIADGEGVSTPAFISKLHEEVLLLHGEARNFSSVLRCTCLVWLEGQGPLAVAAE